MPRQNKGALSAAVETLEEAYETVGRLTQAGFPRQGIKVTRRAEDLYEVSLHLREADRARAERAVANRQGALAPVGGAGAAIALGLGAALLGAGIFAALTARRMVPRYLRDGTDDPEAAPRAE